jgi:hypothetical protein
MVIFFGPVLRSGGWLGSGLALTALALMVLVVGASLHHAWVKDFQAQGRYLFAIIPILGTLYGWHYKIIS